MKPGAPSRKARAVPRLRFEVLRAAAGWNTNRIRNSSDTLVLAEAQVSEIDSRSLSWFKHEDNRRFVAERLGSEPWITVYQVIEGTESEGGGWFSALLPNELVPDALTKHTWDLMI